VSLATILLALLNIQFRSIVTYTAFPLKVITWLGLLSFSVCLFFIVYFIYLKYTYGAAVGFTALIVSVIMSAGLIMFCIGIIGEYISRLLRVQTGEPIFVIKEIIK
jgi:dolichol-phosphate mannosyltransferase